MTAWLPRLVARVPATVHTKLLVAFLAIVVLFVTVAAVGLGTLSEVDRRAAALVELQRRIIGYRQIQHELSEQMHRVASALLFANEPSLEATLEHLSQPASGLDRAPVLTKDEAELLGRFRQHYIQLVTQKLAVVRGERVAEGEKVQIAQALPLADRVARLTGELVRKAEADLVTSTLASQRAYATARWVVIGLGVGSVGLALVLGYAFSWSLIGPMKQMDARFRQLASGDFSGRLEVPNRDEMGALAADLNRMSEELRRLYQELKAVNQRLEAASRHKSEFLANMSHELRTPLNAIIGFSEVLSERMFGELNEKQAEYVQDILGSGRHLLSLINDILDLSKVEAGRMELAPTRFNLPATLEDAITLVKERAGRHGIALDLDVDEGLGDVVGDERKIRQSLLNLLSNAVKFTPEGGRVGVRAVLVDGAVEISVSDTGVGIAAEDQERIFEEFRQVGTDYARKQEGTGLGLALTRKFVELHGGRIRVTSEVGRGSTFTFSLPLRERRFTHDGGGP